jgi:hypothetical protein
MTTIDSFSVENIETKLMSVLYTNIDTCFNQFTLFDKLIKEKFPENYNTIINPAIKAKFLLVLRNLTSRFDDIKVEKKDNIYSITCFSDKNNLSNIKNYVPEIKTEYKSDSNSDSNSNSNSDSNSIPIPNLNPEYSDLINYIIENNLSEDMNYVDPFDGNTIFHDLVATNNIDKIKTLIESNKFDYFVKNKHNFTPIELTKDPNTIMCLSVGLANKYVKDITKMSDLEKKVKIYESHNFTDELIIKTSIYYIIGIKIYNTYVKNKFLILSSLVVYLAYCMYFPST